MTAALEDMQIWDKLPLFRSHSTGKFCPPGNVESTLQDAAEGFKKFKGLKVEYSSKELTSYLI
jgi:hypothetical protein